MKKEARKFNLGAIVALVVLIISIILALSVLVNAYGTTNPPVMGHTLGELNVGANCGAGQVLKNQ